MKPIRCLIGVAFFCAAAAALGEEAAPLFPVPPEPSFLDSIPWDVFSRGGPIMWAILLVAVLGLGFALERCIGLRRRKNIPHEFHKDVVHVVDTRGVDAGLALCTQKPSSLSRVLHAALLRYGSGRKDMEEAVGNEGRRVHYDLCRRTRVIGRMSALAPLLGLLGTCVGLMDCCDLGTPVTNALLPLAFGLGTGIVLLYLYLHLRGKADDVVRTIDELGVDMVVTLDRKARQSIRLIEDIEEHIPTKDMPAVKEPPPELARELEPQHRGGSGVKTSITTPVHLPAAEPAKQAKED